MTVTERSKRIFQECVESGEPCFVLRAKDDLAIKILGAYLVEVNIALFHADEMSSAIGGLIKDFVDWREANPSKTQLPDMRDGEL